MTAINLTGQRFQRLVVVARAGTGKENRALWRAKCDCGQERVFCGKRLRSGETKSCGCLKREHMHNLGVGYGGKYRHLLVKHGHRPFKGKATRTYHSWMGMVQRCTDQNQQFFKNYGGRGITVCERWRIFANFLADMGERPIDRTIDRINNDGNYEPGNCRWATRKEQRANQSPSRRQG